MSARTIVDVIVLAPHPDEFFEHVLRHDVPWELRGPRTPVDDWRRWWDGRRVAGPVERLGSVQGWAVTVPQLRELGLQRHDVRRLLRRGTFWPAGYGVVGVLDISDRDSHLQARRRHAVLAAAATRVRSDHIVDGRSAAILHGLPTREVPTLPEVVGPDSTGRREAVHTHAARLVPTDVTGWFGVPVTRPARTLVDLARRDPDDAIMAADAALRARLLTRRQLRHALDGAVGWPGIRRAREVLALACALAESPLESVSRLRLYDDGFPPPVLQLQIGEWRVDACWPERRLILECDGRAKYTDDQLWREKRRERHLRAVTGGWTVERVTWSDVTSDWPQTRAALRGFFAAEMVTSRRW